MSPDDNWDPHPLNFSGTLGKLPWSLGLSSSMFSEKAEPPLGRKRKMASLPLKALSLWIGYWVPVGFIFLIHKIGPTQLSSTV